MTLLASLRFVAIIVTIACSIPLIAAVSMLFELGGYEDVKQRSLSLGQFVHRTILWIAGIRVEVERCNSRNLDSSLTSTALILSNHVSYLDVIVIGAIMPTTFVAKQEVARWPIIGGAASALSTLFVVREKLASRVLLLRNMRRALLGTNVCVFPEGTTTAEVAPDVTSWHAGNLWPAAQVGARVTMVGIAYQGQRECAWVQDDSFAPHLFNFLKRRHTVVRVSIETTVLEADADLRMTASQIRTRIGNLCRKSHAHLARDTLTKTDQPYIAIQEEMTWKS